MSIEHTPEHQENQLDIIESQFYPAAQMFTIAKNRDQRDSSMNKDFVALRAAAADRVNELLDQYLDLSEMINRAVPLEPPKTA